MLEHPLKEKKAFFLGSVLQQELDINSSESRTALGALFPELYLKDKGLYRRLVIEKFDIQGLKQGDQTEAILSEAVEFLERLPKCNNTKPAIVIEAINNQMSAIRFLCSHYFYHGMFPWFWTMFNNSRDTRDPVLFNFATMVSFFEGRPLRETGKLFEKAFDYQSDNKIRQRLLNEWGVICLHSSHHTLANKFLKQSYKLLRCIPDDSERNCREAELLNARAFYFMKIQEYDEAQEQLLAAQSLIRNFCSNLPRAQRVNKILNINLKRIADLTTTSG